MINKEIKSLRKAYKDLFELIVKKGFWLGDLWVLKSKNFKKIKKIHSKLSKIYGEKKK